MKFVFDSAKEQANIRKHGLDFSLAARVFADPLSVTLYDGYHGGEHRYWRVGVPGMSKTLVIVHTYPDRDDENIVRIISIREATRRERRQYEETSE